MSDSYRIEIVVVRLGLDLRTGQWGDIPEDAPALNLLELATMKAAKRLGEVTAFILPPGRFACSEERAVGAAMYKLLKSAASYSINCAAVWRTGRSAGLNYGSSDSAFKRSKRLVVPCCSVQ